MAILTDSHPRFKEFYSRLGELLRDGECRLNHDNAIRAMRDMGGINIDASLEWMEENGGFCDCEIMFNCDHVGEREHLRDLYFNSPSELGERGMQYTEMLFRQAGIPLTPPQN